MGDTLSLPLPLLDAGDARDSAITDTLSRRDEAICP